MKQGEVLWRPEEHELAETVSDRFRRFVEHRHDRRFEDFAALHRWSIADIDRFWSAVVEFFDADLGQAWRTVRGGSSIEHPLWFPGATLNYAARALGAVGADDAVVSISQSRPRWVLSRDDLRTAVSRCRAGMQRLGVRVGDTVAGYLPNAGEAVVAHLAAASLGAVWSSCAPELGTAGVVERFGQIRPKLLVAVDGYVYGDRRISRIDEVRSIVQRLPSVEQVVLVGHADVPAEADDGWMLWAELLAEDGPLAFERVTFEHPLVVLYSSGTTGPPKAIVHGHGGVLLEHLKWLGLHFDVRDGDRFSWFSTTSWVMWNASVSALLHGATTVLFDGNPNHPDLSTLWHLAADERLTCFGVGAGFLTASRRAGMDIRGMRLEGLRVLGSTGSPLPLEEYGWVYGQLPDVMLASASGGTDVATAFVGGCPLLPVLAGEISGTSLGVDAVAIDASGDPVLDKRGELAIRQPMPSMPVGLWGDADGQRLHDSYFAHLPGMWRQGDWVVHTSRRSWIVAGRSDATLNRGGVRLGTGEYYSLLEADGRIADSVVVFLDGEPGGNGRLVLIVTLTDKSATLSDGLLGELKALIRSQLSPRHVPDHILLVDDLPRTRTGKKLEVPVKRLLLGESVAEVLATDSLANPDSIAGIVALRTLFA